ncbi:MAG: hypothetical protein LBV55_01535 [Acholeplasmatales bacterium]|nr:hypothetical protein [Acholeplasmatales bacterium]
MKKKKGLWISYFVGSILSFTVLCLISMGYAFFSDSHSDSLDIKAGNLIIDAQVKYKLNGQEISALDQYSAGDVLVICFETSNLGNKSAWTKAVAEITSTVNIADDALILFKGNRDLSFCQNNVNLGTNISGTSLEFSSNILVVSGNPNLSDAEIETPRQESQYSVTASNTTNHYITIYFNPSASNAVIPTFQLILLVEAVQYRNNNSQIPLNWN